MRARRRLIGLGLVLGLAARPAAGGDLRDLYFGEALFHACQGQYFDALQRLDTELAMYRGLDQPELDTLHSHFNDAEFSVGDFELNYRMHHRAGRAIKAVLEGAVDEAVRNEAAFRLARIHFQKGQLDDALHALARIQGTVPEEIRDDVEFLRANIYMATGRPSEAVEGARAAAERREPDRVCRLQPRHRAVAGRPTTGGHRATGQGRAAGGRLIRDGLAIRDKSNLVLGTILFESANFDRAKQSLDRVRLEGPFSNQALLRAGWAEASAKQYDRALVPWNILADREPTDVAVQEAMLAVPHAYASLNLHGRAAIDVRPRARAVQQPDRESRRIDRQHQGRAVPQGADSRGDPAGQGLGHPPAQPARCAGNLLPDGVDGLSRLPDRAAELPRPRGSALEAHRPGRRASTRSTTCIRLRGQNYEPLLPEVDAEFRELDSRMRLRLEQRKHLGNRLQAILTAPRPEFLATAEERVAGERIALLEKQLGDADSPDIARASAARGPPARRAHLAAGDRVPRAADRGPCAPERAECADRGAHAPVRRLRQDAAGGDAQLRRIRRRRSAGSASASTDALQRVDLLMARQGQMIETVAINQLEARRKRLVAQQTEARYGVADSYDRAARAQAAAEAR